MAENSSSSIEAKRLKPLVSIIIPLYNRRDMVQETINSVIAQTYRHWEALVIDDGSEDNSQQVIESYARKDSRIRFFQRYRNPKGANTCRNIGIEHANGDYLIFLDSDDLLAPFCLAQRIKCFLESSQYDFIVFPQLFFEKQPNDLDALVNVSTEEYPLYRFLRLDTVWLTSQPIWKIAAIKELEGFDEDLNSWQDLDLHLRALKAGFRFLHYSDLPPDCYWRVNHGGRITDPAKIVSHIPSRKKVIKLGLSFLEVSSYDQSKIMFGVRILFTSIIINLLKGKKFKEAYAFLSQEEKLLKRLQKFKLYIIIFLHQLNAEKIRGFLRMRNLFLGELYPKNKLWGKYKFKKNELHTKVKSNDQ